ncbi:MAG TPA: GTP-binding protein HSR1, partial [Gammaproteobacteria bacterium]|nr:GTP-binding protein HSR1 [Gammaproteobacteria bacterium]
VSVGKSSLLNALAGTEAFSTSPLHGETRQIERTAWQAYDAGGVFLIDTPGLDEVDGESREALAYEATSRADLILFVADADLTSSELAALRQLHESGSLVLLVLNKSDRYSSDERDSLLESLLEHAGDMVPPENILSVSAAPAPQTVIIVDDDGTETATTRQPEPDISSLVDRLWEIIESEGKSLAALNASLFASRISDTVSQRIMETRRSLAERLIRYYSIAKGLGVAVNPIPVADLAAAAAIDSAMVYHLSQVYDLPMSRRESGKLVAVIFAQLALLMGAIWTVHLASSLLKLTSAGLSTLITASGQGAIAYYSTYLVGQITERYLEQGKSWGEGGPKLVTEEILAGMDKNSIIEAAREDILDRLQRST